MMAVERVRVGDVLALQRRPVAVEPDREYEEIGVRSFGRGIFHKEPVDGASLGSKRVFALAPGDLVISNVFAWEGAVAVASEAESGRIGSHRFMTFVPIEDRIDTAWAAWFFQSEPGLALLRRASPGSAGRNRTLAITRFETLEIPLPPVEEQRRVADRLDRSLQRVIAIRKRCHPAVDSVRRLLDGWIDRRMGRSEQEYTLSDVATVYRGRGPRYEPGTGLLAINQACVRWGRIDLAQAREVDTDWWSTVPDQNRVRTDDVLVNSTGEGTIGRVALADQSVATTPFDSHVLAVRCDTNVLLPTFLATYLRSRAGQLQIEQAKGANTTKQTELGKTKLGQFVIPTPSLERQADIASHVHEMTMRIQRLNSLLTDRGTRLAAIAPSVLNQALGNLA
jgi:type I restriction enzyme, S subunit